MCNLCGLSLIHGGLVTCNHVNEVWNGLNFHVNVGMFSGVDYPSGTTRWVWVWKYFSTRVRVRVTWWVKFNPSGYGYGYGWPLHTRCHLEFWHSSSLHLVAGPKPMIWPDTRTHNIGPCFTSKKKYWSMVHKHCTWVSPRELRPVVLCSALMTQLWTWSRVFFLLLLKQSTDSTWPNHKGKYTVCMYVLH